MQSSSYSSMKNPGQILRDALKEAGLPLDHYQKIKGLYWLRTLGFAPIIDEFASFIYHELQEITGGLDASREFKKAVNEQKALVQDAMQTPNAWGVLQVWCPDVNGDLWLAGDRHALNNLKQCIEIALESDQQFATFAPRSAFVTGGRGGDPFIVKDRRQWSVC